MREFERILLELKSPGILERAGVLPTDAPAEVRRIASLRVQILISQVADPVELARLRDEVSRVASEAVSYLQANQVEWER